MRSKLGLIVTGGLLLLTAVATPVSAQGPATVRVLNALPGTRLEICVSGNGEVVSGLLYGKASARLDLDAGTWTVQARVASKGTCKGARLASRSGVVVDADSNLTFVLWKPKDKAALKVFENDVAVPDATAVTLVMRHAAKAGAFDAWVWQHVKPAADDYFVPTFDDLAKGASSTPLVLDERQVLIEAFPSVKSAPWDYEYLWQYLFTKGAYQVYFIGTERSNYQIVLLGEEGVPPPP
jgi:hypothetical protein